MLPSRSQTSTRSLPVSAIAIRAPSVRGDSLPRGTRGTLPAASGQRRAVNAGPTATDRLRPSRSCAITSPSAFAAVAFTGRHRNHVAVRVDHDQRRPGTNAVLLPRLQLRVVQDGVGDAMPGDRSRDRGVVRLVRELRGVHADDDQPVAETLLERPQLLHDAQAVDAAERPEIEQHDAPTKLTQREGIAPVLIHPPAPRSSGARTRPSVVVMRVPSSREWHRSVVPGTRSFGGSADSGL